MLRQIGVRVRSEPRQVEVAQPVRRVRPQGQARHALLAEEDRRFRAWWQVVFPGCRCLVAALLMSGGPGS
eukprot:10481302-Alexandrium_andersonii.AAC.1